MKFISIVILVLSISSQAFCDMTDVEKLRMEVNRLQEFQKNCDARQFEETVKAEKEFLGYTWGIGVGLSYDLSGNRVTDAEMVNGIVRSKQESSARPRVFLEIHKLYPIGKARSARKKAIKKNNFTEGSKETEELLANLYPQTLGLGPFIAVQSSADEVIDAIGFGLMLGWRSSERTGSHFNIGIGFLLDGKAKVLGDGIELDKELPEGETDVRFKEEERWNFMLVFSFSY